MSEQENESSLEQEFESLGKNIRNALQGAWGSEERKRLSEEIQKGLNEVGTALEKVAGDLQRNETVQQVSSEIDEIADQVTSGQLAAKLKAETVEVLQGLNQELEGWIQRWTAAEESDKTPSE